MNCAVYIPDSASGPKLAQIEAYGATLIPVPGPRSQATEAVLEAVKQGNVYASHAYFPHGLLGYATVAYEIVEQISAAPGTVIVPAGHGNFLLGLARGFKALRLVGKIDHMPRLVGVQVQACAPLWSLFFFGQDGLSSIVEGETLAEGIRVRYPARGAAVIQAVQECNGLFVTVTEESILTARDYLARKGLFVEPTSAVVLPAFRQLEGKVADPIVFLITGSGLKYRNTD
jgi:threonine synthase